jgi:adenylate kinase
MALNVIMLGPPGAGKGTQAEQFARAHDIPRISTGDILRDGIKRQLPLAIVASAKMDRGELVDDATMVGIVRDRLSQPDTARGFVLDGFPRTVVQARALDQLMQQRGTLLTVVDIVVPEDELVRRLSVRRICSLCGTNASPGDRSETCGKCGGTFVYRADDDDRVVRDRLRVYADNTRPLVDYYRGRPAFRSVNGAQSAERVAQELEAAIVDAMKSAPGVPPVPPLGAQVADR